jgi:hypothetical protein
MQRCWIYTARVSKKAAEKGPLHPRRPCADPCAYRPLSSSMIAPAAGQVAEYLNITDEVEVQMSVSIFVLGELTIHGGVSLSGRDMYAEDSY